MSSYGLIGLIRSLKKEIQVVKCLSETGEVPGLRKVLNNTMIATTSSKFDNRAITIDDILENDVRFASMLVSYKVYQSSRRNSVSRTLIYSAYQMLKDDKRYDLCTVLLNELMSNLKKIKKDRKHTFKYGSLLICLALYFLNEIPNIKGKVQWAYNRPITMQTKEGLWGIGDVTMRISTLWGYFKTFQATMKRRERPLRRLWRNMRKLFASWLIKINVK